MFYLLFQMLLYMLVALILGVVLGWLLWRHGYAREIMTAFGMDPGPVPAGDGAPADYAALRSENARLSEELAQAGSGDGADALRAELAALKAETDELRLELSNANAERSALQNDLDACRAERASMAAAASAAPVLAEAVDLDPGIKPTALVAPRGGAADDLKEIKGIGVKLEEMLHGMGIYHFDQIAAWGPKELAWVDQNLEGFKGRASRDNWIGQAKTLA